MTTFRFIIFGFFHIFSILNGKCGKVLNAYKRVKVYKLFLRVLLKHAELEIPSIAFIRSVYHIWKSLDDF